MDRNIALLISDGRRNNDKEQTLLFHSVCTDFTLVNWGLRGWRARISLHWDEEEDVEEILMISQPSVLSYDPYIDN